MKIQSSNVSMQSERTYFSYEKYESVSIQQKSEDAAKLDLSDTGKSKAKQLQDVVDEKEKAEKEEKKANKEKQKKNAKDMMDNYLESLRKHKVEAKQPESAKSPEELRIEIMKRILELLRHGKPGRDNAKEIDKLAKDMKNVGTSAGSGNAGICGEAPADNAIAGEINPVANPGRLSNATWVRTTVQSAFYMETENTAFQSVGTVKTADGRSIDFNVTLEMSRSFCATYESFTQEKYYVCDPLVINADAGFTGLEDQTFLFDLDADGEKEEISQLAQGSGFLALDKNGNGTIDDGNELFGTKSGDGFKDLAEYDEDGNGWIDENDSVFNKLKLWTKDEKGNMTLVDLKTADVGAIYLGKVGTQFSLNDKSNSSMGFVRSTGVFLKESGGAGTVQHVDLTL